MSGGEGDVLRETVATLRRGADSGQTGTGFCSWGRKRGRDLGSALGMKPYFWSSGGFEAGWNSPHHDTPHILNSCFSWSVDGSIHISGPGAFDAGRDSPDHDTPRINNNLNYC